LIAGYCSFGCSLLVYDAYTIIGGILLVLIGLVQVITTIILFVVSFLHGHSPRCLNHIIHEDEEIKTPSSGKHCSCLSRSRKITGVWIGSLLILFIITQLVAVSLVIGFDYQLTVVNNRGVNCGNL
jgi:uncharacterized membrane protein